MQTQGGAKAATFVLVTLILSSACATQFLAQIFAYQPALGAHISLGSWKLYAPWSVLPWSASWADAFPRAFAAAHMILIVGGGLSFLLAAAVMRQRVMVGKFGQDAWAKFADVEQAGLFAKEGTVLGKFNGEILAYDGPGHQILIGASRSGKGRGHVIPTILSWSRSALILDVKGELDRGDTRHGFPGTSGYRAQLGPVLRFAPTDPTSNSFNVLLCVRKGANEVRDVQNIVDGIVEPHGETRGPEQFWNKTAKVVIAGVVLHTLYSEPDGRKALSTVREKLRDLDRTCDEMRRTIHRLDPKTNTPQVHPEVLHAAESYLAGEERLRSGIKATAESFFGVFADPIVAEKTSRSDFHIADLMCAERPVTLYLQPPPSDTQRLMPLLRLLIAEVARALMENQTHANNRQKRHRLMLVLDEFPQLGRLDFFEKMMGAMAGYGLKAYLVCQSLNHIVRAYGRDNVILDNCAIVTTFAASDPETAKHIADMAGEAWEIRPTESEQRPRALFHKKGSITYREERRPLLLPADVRSLPSDQQLIFAAGAKPIRAKKLRFDQEPIFAKRLMPAAPTRQVLSQSHDWVGVRALGMLPAEKKPVSTSRTRERVERPKAQQSDTPQNDLFTVPSPPAPAQPSATPKISELAVAGLRPAVAPQQEAQTKPTIDTQQPRKRGTGV